VSSLSIISPSRFFRLSKEGLILAACLWPTLSWGADWRAVSSANANGTVFSVDIDSIVERDNLISAWTMESRKSPKSMKLQGKRFKYMSYKALRYFNCDSGRIAIAQGIFYSRGSGDLPPSGVPIKRKEVQVEG
jgi:hypothetical protein